MLRLPLALTVLLLASPASHADNNCETIRAQIDAKIRASGVAAFTLAVVEANANVAGKVVGSCGQGTKKIVYAQTSAASAPAKPSRAGSEPILTECKDGSVSLGGECKKAPPR